MEIDVSSLHYLLKVLLMLDARERRRRRRREREERRERERKRGAASEWGEGRQEEDGE